MIDSDELSQKNTPLLDALQDSSHRDQAPFYVPGHKRGKGISSPLLTLLGKDVFRYDLPELPEFGNLLPAEGVMKQAQDLAAQAFGADQTWFLANGSTSGVIAAILGTCGDGEKIILPRNVHQSAIAGLILSGAIPIFINPVYDSIFDLPYNITPTALESAIAQHPDSKAIFITSPTYQGVCADIAAIAQLAHSYNIPLIVDAAHGAHFGFHPQFPPSPLTLGADIVIHSVHKTLGALTQASLLHLQGQRLSATALTSALQCLQSSSPSHLLLASLDAARQQVATAGEKLLGQALGLAQQVTQDLQAIPEITLFSPSTPQPSCRAIDPTRITIDVSGLGLTGFAADEMLHEQLAVTAELPTAKTLTFVITFGNTEADIETLGKGLRKLKERKTAEKISSLTVSSLPPLAPCISPRQAFFGEKETLPLSVAVGKISAELICPYPPGIPVLMPGELITTEAVSYIQQVLALGSNVSITGCSDSSLETLQVWKRSS
ncbi:MAG: aminotransferase class I/II-fold pyridoxal phosphate-dependent enzyme [Halothece sp. Uz-M2-17]|nr:aminotransferase class I/II-fold pyridoxal phosphate-dependent enzyme [Halothece sp. Uz-M2-17]